MERAQEDIKRITSDLNGFAKSITFSYPYTGQAATIQGIHSKINLAVDTEGMNVNSRKAHISFSESALTDQGYQTRTAQGVINLKDHLVTVTDSTGEAIQYIVTECFPDETVGLIVCMLGAYEE